MDLISHIGVVPGPRLTFRRVLYSLRAALALAGLAQILALYHVVGVASLVARRFAPRSCDIVQRAVIWLFWSAALLLVAAGRIDVVVCGDHFAPESAVLLCNHQSLADYFFVVYLARRAGARWSPQVNFFSWCSLWRIPSLKVWFNLVCCDENWELSKLLSRTVFRRVLQSSVIEWVVIFPEVNIYTPTLSYFQRLHAQKYCLPYLDHLLYPRFSAVLNAVQTINGNAKFLRAYDITILYSRPPTLLQLFASADAIVVTIEVKEIALAKIPLKKRQLQKWLERTWLEKDRLLEQKRSRLGQDESTV